MPGRNRRRGLIWARAVDHNLRIARIVLYNGVDVVRLSRNGAWNQSLLYTKPLWPQVKDEGLLAFLDQSTKLLDGDPLGGKSTEERLPAPPPRQQIQSNHCKYKQQPELSDVREYEQNIGDLILKYSAHDNGRTYKHKGSNYIERNKTRERHFGDAGHCDRNGRKRRKQFRKQQGPGSDFHEHGLRLTDTEIR